MEISKKIVLWFTRLLYVKKINGSENIPKKGAFILAANHCSYIDHLFLYLVVLPKYNKVVHFLAKKEHFRGFIQCSWHRWVYAIPIDREAGGKEALKEAIKCLRKGKIIGIYPEGTRSLDGKIQRGKTGVARLALIAKVPVVPVGLINTFKILPKGRFIPKGGKIGIINIGKPMFFKEYYKKENDHTTLRRVTTKIMKETAKLSNQKYNFR